jgi:hypothetical protein
LTRNVPILHPFLVVALGVMDGENPILEEVGPQQPQNDQAEVSDMIELTPEGVGDHFSRLQELMSDHVCRESLRGVQVRLSYDEELSATTTPPAVSTQGGTPFLPLARRERASVEMTLPFHAAEETY